MESALFVTDSIPGVLLFLLPQLFRCLALHNYKLTSSNPASLSSEMQSWGTATSFGGDYLFNYSCPVEMECLEKCCP